MNEKLLQTTSSKKDIYAHNLKYFKWLEFFSSLYFIVPIWVIIELKFLTLSELLIVEGVIAGSQLFLELPTGALADLLGRKNTITLGFLIGAIGFGLFSFATNFIQFLIIGILFGLQASLISGAKEALVFDTLKQAHREEEYSPLINKLQIIFNWGIAGATLIGGLMFALNFYLPGILNGLAFLIATFIAAKLIEPDIDSEIFTLKNYLKQTKEGFRELFKTPQSKDISLYYILIGGLTWPFVVALQNISLTLMGFNEKQMGLIIPAMMLGSIYILHFLIKKDFFKKQHFVFYFLAILIIPSLLLGWWLNIYLVIPILFAISLASSTRGNVLGKLSNQQYSSKNRATAISSLSMAISLIYVLVMLAFSKLGQTNDNALNIMYLSMGLISLFTILPMSLKLAKKNYKKEIDLNLDTEPEIYEAPVKTKG